MANVVPCVELWLKENPILARFKRDLNQAACFVVSGERFLAIKIYYGFMPGAETVLLSPL